jgi:hypothetical protein
LCGREVDRLQLMRISLGGCTATFMNSWSLAHQTQIHAGSALVADGA